MYIDYVSYRYIYFQEIFANIFPRIRDNVNFGVGRGKGLNGHQMFKRRNNVPPSIS